MKRYGILPRPGKLPRLRDLRLRDLRVATRLALGFGVALALVGLLTVVGVVSLFAVTRDVGTFSRYADASQAAADMDIGLRDLEVAVRDYLAESAPQSLADAGLRHDGLASKITTLSDLVTTPADRESVGGAMKALDAYWGGFQTIVALRSDRAKLVQQKLDPLVQRIRDGLDRLKDAGGVDSASLAADATAAILLMQDHLTRYIDRRNDHDAERVRSELGAARNRLAAMNRYLWVPGTRQTIDEVAAGFGDTTAVLDEIEKTLGAEDGLRADTLAPNAAAISAHAAEIRQRNDDIAQQLRGGLFERSWRTVKIALWIGGGILLIGLVLVWIIARSVSRPLDRMADAVAKLSLGITEVRIPPATGNDEIASLARSVHGLRDNTVAMERLRAEAEEMHSQLTREKERVDATNLAKTNFLVNMGHELHGPLNSIVASSQGLLGELHRLGAGELANDVEQIQWTGEQLLTLLDSILDYAKIEAGTMEVVLQDFDVNRLLVELRERSLATADLHGNDIAVEAEPALGQMYSDFGKVRQALLNLLDNACQFTRDGTVTLSAERFERDGEQWVRYSVTDTGVGFPAAQAGRLFQPFAQGLPANSNRRGAGLGLTLVGHYVAMLGGDIEVASETGHGTRMTLTLPAYYQPPTEERPLQVGVAGGGSAAGGGKAKRPLVTIGALRPMAQLAP